MMIKRILRGFDVVGVELLYWVIAEGDNETVVEDKVAEIAVAMAVDRLTDGRGMLVGIAEGRQVDIAVGGAFETEMNGVRNKLYFD